GAPLTAVARSDMGSFSESSRDSTSLRNSSSSPQRSRRNSARTDGSVSTAPWKIALACCQRSVIRTPLCSVRGQARPWPSPFAFEGSRRDTHDFRRFLQIQAGDEEFCVDVHFPCFDSAALIDVAPPRIFHQHLAHRAR